MDSRLLNPETDQNAQNTNKQQILEDSEVYIPIDEVEQSKQFKDALLYNLVKKMNLLDEMTQQYNQQLSNIETYPKFAKYYIHASYLLPTTLVVLFYLKYKKKLNINTSAIVVCGAVAFNEFAKSHKIRKINPEKAKEYNEHSHNYTYLLNQFTSQIKFTQILRNILGFDISQQNNINNAPDEYVHEFIQGTYN